VNQRVGAFHNLILVVRLLLQQLLYFQPIGETLDPTVGGEALFSHTEAVSALLIKVQPG